MTLVYDVECKANYNTYWFEIKYQGETWQVYDKEDDKWLASYLTLDEVEESPIFDDYPYSEWTKRSRTVL